MKKASVTEDSHYGEGNAVTTTTTTLGTAVDEDIAVTARKTGSRESATVTTTTPGPAVVSTGQ